MFSLSDYTCIVELLWKSGQDFSEGQNNTWQPSAVEQNFIIIIIIIVIETVALRAVRIVTTSVSAAAAEPQLEILHPDTHN